MPMRDLLPSAPRPAPTPAADRPDGVTCEHYVRAEGKRCLHYASNGACNLPDEFMCVEWLKANGPNAKRGLPLAPTTAPSATPERDLFGNPVQVVAAVHAPKAARLSVATSPGSKPVGDGAHAIDVDELRGFTTADIDSFKARGVEVCLRSEAIGDVWLVPAYTGQDRREITPENAATLLRVMSVFPGTALVSFTKPAPQPERPERLSRHS